MQIQDPSANLVRPSICPHLVFNLLVPLSVLIIIPPFFSLVFQPLSVLSAALPHSFVS